jgi:hypothetical protein
VVNRRRLKIAEVGFWIGAVVMIAGTFAPWLRSGRIDRNSYQAAGLLERVLDIDGWAAHALDALPLLPVSCAAAIALSLFGWRWLAVIVVGVVALGLAALSAALLLAPGSREISVAGFGPAVTLGGAVLTLAAAVSSVVFHRADRSYGHIPV